MAYWMLKKAPWKKCCLKEIERCTSTEHSSKTRDYKDLCGGIKYAPYNREMFLEIKGPIQYPPDQREEPPNFLLKVISF